MVTKAWSATKAIVAISKRKEAATSLSMKNKSKPKSATTASGCYGLTPSTIPKQWLTSIRRYGRSRTLSVRANRFLRPVPSITSAMRPFEAVFCSFLALLLKQELESRMKQAELEWEWKEVIRGLDALQQVEANFQGRRFVFRSD